MPGPQPAVHRLNRRRAQQPPSLGEQHDAQAVDVGLEVDEGDAALGDVEAVEVDGVDAAAAQPGADAGVVGDRDAGGGVVAPRPRDLEVIGLRPRVVPVASTWIE